MKTQQILLFAIFLVFLIPCQSFSKEDKTVTITVSAQGQTISKAKQNALRDAIEQAFGAFVSSNTEILNDELIKDEIVSVSNGNIQDYQMISEVEFPNGFYSTTLKAIKNIFNFKTKSQLTLNIDEIKTIRVDSRVIGQMNDRTLAGGFVPFSSPSFRDYRDYVDYFVGYDFSDFQVPLSLAPKKYSLLEDLRIGYSSPKNINNKLERRYRAGRTFGNVMLTHKYIEDGLIYEINGSTDLILKELSKISILRIEY